VGSTASGCDDTATVEPKRDVMPRTGFDPAEHGFQFPNAFVNSLGNLPGFGQIRTQGRCGGMAYASLDYYHAGLRVPETSDLPPDGTLLADYIFERLLDSFLVASASKFISWTLYTDYQTFFYKGVTRWTKEDEFPRMRRGIEHGAPQVLGLVRATDLQKIGDDHQVVAFACDDDGAGALTALLYDNRYPGEEVILGTTPEDPHWTLSHDGPEESWRGFFVQGYERRVPDHLTDGTTLESGTGTYVVYGGAKFDIASSEQLGALGLSEDDAETVSDGSIHWIADVPATGTLLRELSSADVYVIAGRRLHPLGGPEALEVAGYSPDHVRVVPDGSLAKVPREGDDDPS
jgi:hypothetical protein